jgi:tetratricopeptide (TPR) repeat protein
VRLKTFIRGSLVALACIAPALADDAPASSMTAIATALREGRGQDAETLATRMLSSSQSSPPIDHAYLLLNRGLAREQMGKREGAVKDFTAAIDTKALAKGELARALFDRGVALDELGRTDEAIADYSQALAIVPRYATALNNRGNAYRRTGRYALARADYQSALGAGDDEPEYPLYGLGRVAEALNDKSMAKSFYRQALAANGQFPPAMQRMAALGDVPADGSYTLRTPGSDAPQPSAEPKTADLKPETRVAKEIQSPAADESFSLRPAILEVGRKAKARQKPIRLASIAPPEISELAPGPASTAPDES